MKLYTIEVNGKDYVAGLGCDGKVYPLEGFGYNYADMNELIEKTSDADIRKMGETLAAGENLAGKEGYCLDQIKILAPIQYPRQDLLCLGVNYADHLAESSKSMDFGKKAATVYFSKRVNKASGVGDSIPLHPFVDSLDYEVELGVVIKEDTFGAKKEDALSHVFGYTIVNDVSARNIQTKHLQWYIGKSLDGYTPMGPCIVTADEIEDVQNLWLTCHINGELRQKSNTSNMITKVADCIEELSEGITLRAGTIIATGTPAGVAMGMDPQVYLKKGDEVLCEIEGIGKLLNIVG